MQLLKSQLNKILTSMEKQELIERVQSQDDRRKMEIRLKPGAEDIYLQAHERILKIMQHVCQNLGVEQSQQLTKLLHGAVQAIDQLPDME